MKSCQSIYKIPILICLLILAFPIVAQEDLNNLLDRYNSHSIPYISAEELRKMQQDLPPILLDAREPEEFSVSRIKNAEFAGYNNFSAEKFSAEIQDKNTLIVVYCSLGIRSETVSEKMKNEGFTNVRNLHGGIFEWVNKGFPVFDATGMRTQKVHAFSPEWARWLKKGEKVYH